MKYSIILLSMFLFVGHVLANEPLWTDTERAENRDIVIQGEVQSVEKKHNIDEYADLYIAKIKVVQIYKGNPKFREEIIDVYYEFSTNGESMRFPKYAELKQGDIGKFFIIDCDAGWKKRIKMEKIPDIVLFIEMGSDVQLKNR